jgi:hypothetical protein
MSRPLSDQGVFAGFALFRLRIARPMYGMCWPAYDSPAIYSYCMSVTPRLHLVEATHVVVLVFGK